MTKARRWRLAMMKHCLKQQIWYNNYSSPPHYDIKDTHERIFKFENNTGEQT